MAEGWLGPPAAGDGEDEVLVWLVETVLRGGSAMIDDIPYGRVRPLRQRAARHIKAAIGGTVMTATVSPTTILVYSTLVIEARTEDQQHQEIRDAILRPMGQRGGSSARPARLATPVLTDRPTIGMISNTESGRRLSAAKGTAVRIIRG